MWADAHILTRSSAKIFLHLSPHKTKRRHVLEMHVTSKLLPPPPEDRSLLYAHFLSEVLREFYLRKNEAHFQNQRKFFLRSLLNMFSCQLEWQCCTAMAKCHHFYF